MFIRDRFGPGFKLYEAHGEIEMARGSKFLTCLKIKKVTRKQQRLNAKRCASGCDAESVTCNGAGRARDTLVCSGLRSNIF